MRLLHDKGYDKQFCPVRFSCPAILHNFHLKKTSFCPSELSGRVLILGDPGATSRDDVIFSARKFASRAEEHSSALEVNFRAENITSFRPVTPLVSEDAD